MEEGNAVTMIVQEKDSLTSLLLMKQACSNPSEAKKQMSTKLKLVKHFEWPIHFDDFKDQAYILKKCKEGV